MTENKKPDAAEPTPRKKRPYEPPTLKRLGRIRDLTLGGAGSVVDAVGGMMRRM